MSAAAVVVVVQSEIDERGLFSRQQLPADHEDRALPPLRTRDIGRLR
jgi:hypothetical protein